jgi:hypothetical protein
VRAKKRCPGHSTYHLFTVKRSRRLNKNFHRNHSMSILQDERSIVICTHTYHARYLLSYDATPVLE